MKKTGIIISRSEYRDTVRVQRNSRNFWKTGFISAWLGRKKQLRL